MTDDESLDAMGHALLRDLGPIARDGKTMSLIEVYELAWRSSAQYHTKRAKATPVTPDFQKALHRAFVLGQSYWADADSESYSANKRADKHRQDFDALFNEWAALPVSEKPE